MKINLKVVIAAALLLIGGADLQLLPNKKSPERLGTLSVSL